MYLDREGREHFDPGARPYSSPVPSFPRSPAPSALFHLTTPAFDTNTCKTTIVRLLLFLAACSVAILLLRGARYSVTRIPFWIATLEFEPQSWFESLIGPLYLLVFALICSCGMFFVFFMANGLNLFYHQAAHDPLSKPGNLVKVSFVRG